jgi:hypothetical protein
MVRSAVRPCLVEDHDRRALGLQGLTGAMLVVNRGVWSALFVSAGLGGRIFPFDTLFAQARR